MLGWQSQLLVALAGLLALAIPRPSQAELPRESPLYGPPYRRGLAAEVAVGLALCQPAPIYAGV
ncbi:MAG: hypothetical protein R6X02_23975 [Enhygromyxa sp.]